MAAPDGRDPYSPGDYSPGDAEWAMSADPADDWILDPESGEYRMRLPGESLPAPAAAPALPVPRSTGAELELRPTHEVRTVTPPAPRPGGRAAARNSRRGGRRRGSDGGGNLWLIAVFTLIGVAGCGFGGYLLFGGHQAVTGCSAAPPPSAAPATGRPGPSDGGPAVTPGPHASPIDVRVTIYDGTGQYIAGDVLIWMQNTEGYLRTTNKGAVPSRSTTSLVYEPAHADQARTLAASLHLPPQDLHGTAKGSGLRDAMTLTLGTDFVKAGQPLRTPPPPTVTPATAHAGCTAS